MSLIMRARTEDGEALTDRELRDELMTLVLAGHETTANQLAWAWERLVRGPAAHARLRRRGPFGVRGRRRGRRGDDQRGDARPAGDPDHGPARHRAVAARRVRRSRPTARIAISILLLHHREDLYPDPFAFRPERWIGHKPGTYEWLPFGGGTRRCLGAALAMAEQRVVLKSMVQRLDIERERQRQARAAQAPQRDDDPCARRAGARQLALELKGPIGIGLSRYA